MQFQMATGSHWTECRFYLQVTDRRPPGTLNLQGDLLERLYRWEYDVKWPVNDNGSGQRKQKTTEEGQGPTACEGGY